jgi:two-component system, cell cycle sensor histidine kinase and response regulator CckA
MSSPNEFTVQPIADKPLNQQFLPATFLRQLFWVTAVSLTLSTFLFLLRGNFSTVDLAVFIVVLFTLLLGVWLLRSNRFLWTAHGFTAVFWLSLTLFMVVYGTFRVPNPGAYLLVILIAMLLVPGRTPYFYALLSFFSAVFLMLAKERGTVPLFQPIPDWVATVGNNYPRAFIVFLLLGTAIYSLRFLLITLRINRESLEEIRQTLGKQTADLSATNKRLRHEISERQQTENALEQQRTFLRQIIDTIPHYVFVKDEQSRLIIVNKALATAYKRTPAEIEGKAVHEFNPHTQEVAQYEEGDQAVLESQEELFWPEIPFTDLDEKKHWLQVVKRPIVDKINNVTYVLGVGTDITLFKTTAEALREKEEQFRTLVEASFDGITICVNSIIQEANVSFATMFGYTSVDKILGKNATFFVTAESINQLQKNARGTATSEVEGIRQDGTIFPVEVISRPINYQGELVQISGYRDISSRKQAKEAELHAQRLESLTIMAGGLAHDFNNLLVAMMGQISIAKAKVAPEHPSLENLDKAMKVTETAALLTRQLLAYTGQGHFQVEPIQINSLIQKNLHLFQDALPANIIFQTNLHDSLPSIQADGIQIQQIIMNLLLNAAQAIGTEAGVITITTAPYQLSPDQVEQWQHFNHSVAAGDFILLEVSDSGQGMDEATQSRIFDPFFSTKGTGHGLSLAAVLGIVRGHKGGVRTISQIGQGTTFQFLFPTAETMELLEETAVSQPHPPQKIVLIIDDDKQVREAIYDILDLEQIPARIAASGEEGVTLFTAYQAQIGLVILDLSMPGMSGIETFAALREIEAAVKIILSSGYTEADILEKMAGTRPTDFLQKPYRLETIINIVKKHLL